VKFTYPDYGRDYFIREIKNNQLTVLHDDGLYRHLRLQRPDSSLFWFDLITWPGALTITGDLDTFTFKREPDMIGFFRGQRINPHYWAEKIVDGRERARTYDEDLFKRHIAAALVEYAPRYPDLLHRYRKDIPVYDATTFNRRYPHEMSGPRPPQKPKTVAELREEYVDATQDAGLATEDGARRLLESWYCYDVTGDPWETSLSSFDIHYLRACHAIQWGIAQYDAAKLPNWCPECGAGGPYGCNCDLRVPSYLSDDPADPNPQ
jgi:hypothetical protein